MKIIFLDFDGPLVTRSSYSVPRVRGERVRAWPPCVQALNRITDTTGAMIVVSSAWRYAGLEQTKSWLSDWGVTGRVIGLTPILPGTRGSEIYQYLTEFEDICDTAISFVILDDDTDMDHLISHLICTPFGTGLTEELADAAIKMLE